MKIPSGAGTTLRYYDIFKEKNKDKDILSKLNSHKDYEFITFSGGNKNHKLVCHNDMIVLPQTLQKNTIE